MRLHQIYRKAQDGGREHVEKFRESKHQPGTPAIYCIFEPWYNHVIIHKIPHRIKHGPNHVHDGQYNDSGHIPLDFDKIMIRGRVRRISGTPGPR